MLFETADQLAQAVKTFKADEGLKQNAAKLELYLLRSGGQAVRGAVGKNK